MQTDRQAPPLILCIPGPWTSRAELLARVIEDSDGYLFAGHIILHMETQFACTLELEDSADPNMARAFAISDTSKDGTFTQSIAEHKSVVYLIGDGGSHAAAQSMMQTAAALLKAGGLGVKVESSGISHAPARWHDLVTHLYLFKAHEALVVYVTGDAIRSCGMQCLGLPEATIDASLPGATVELLRVFTNYLFTESPTIREGQTFSVDSSAPVFRLHFEAGYDYGSDSLFNNPYGAWRLTPACVEEEPPQIGNGFLRALRSRWLN